MSRPFAIVVAADEALGIGQNGRLPWRLSGDMAFYRRITSEAPEGKQNVVIMGRKTFESIPEKFRPLPNRINVVLTRDPSYRPAAVHVASSLAEALALSEQLPQAARTFVVGGGELYREALGHPACQEVLITRVHARFACDTFLAPFEASFHRTRSDGPHYENGLSYTFETYTRNTSERERD